MNLENLSITPEELGYRLTGRAAKPVTMEVIGELAPEDFALLGAERGTKPVEIKKLRQRHHALAKLLASGMLEGDAAIACGYTASRVSILLADPSFSELVSFYKRQTDEKYFDAHEAMAALHLDATLELSDRLEADPDKFTIPQLESLVKTMGDRAGFAPTSNVNVNVRGGVADRLALARERVRASRIPPSQDIIDATVTEDSSNDSQE